MKLFITSFVIICLLSCTVSHNPLRSTFRSLQRGKLKDDTSYVYTLPYEKGKRYRMVQGYFSRFTHKERAALDFKMKRGTIVCAAREGVVVRVKEDGDRGGLRKKYRSYGNNIVIQHADGTRAGYWHFRFNGALVQAGDSVKAGQPIGYSGKTGYTALPHLHFLVWRFDTAGHWQQVPTRFHSTAGDHYLRAFRRYKRP